MLVARRARYTLLRYTYLLTYLLACLLTCLPTDSLSLTHLEAHVLHARDHLGSLEVVLRRVAALLVDRLVDR